MPKSSKNPKQALVELEPDAWPRFERFVRDIAKAGPQHRVTAKPKAKASRSPKRKEKRGRRQETF